MNAGDGVVLLADVSGSMRSPAWGSQRKIDVLREAVDATRRAIACTLIAFSAKAREVARIPEPESNTDLVAGLRAAQTHDPGVTLVISDGQPDRPEEALALARTFRGAIDVLYVGPDSDAAAMAFMRRLADAAGGRVETSDIATPRGVQRLEGSLRLLLEGPARPRVLNRHHGAMPAGAVYVGRGTPWGNPFRVGEHGTREEVLVQFARMLETRADLRQRARHELRGRDLVCSCAPRACHADLWLAIANETPLPAWCTAPVPVPAQGGLFSEGGT